LSDPAGLQHNGGSASISHEKLLSEQSRAERAEQGRTSLKPRRRHPRLRRFSSTTGATGHHNLAVKLSHWTVEVPRADGRVAVLMPRAVGPGSEIETGSPSQLAALQGLPLKNTCHLKHLSTLFCADTTQSRSFDITTRPTTQPVAGGASLFPLADGVRCPCRLLRGLSLDRATSSSTQPLHLEASRRTLPVRRTRLCVRRDHDTHKSVIGRS
jgi:hypothetical protein